MQSGAQPVHVRQDLAAQRPFGARSVGDGTRLEPSGEHVRCWRTSASWAASSDSTASFAGGGVWTSLPYVRIASPSLLSTLASRSRVCSSPTRLVSLADPGAVFSLPQRVVYPLDLSAQSPGLGQVRRDAVLIRRACAGGRQVARHPVAW